MITRSEQLFYYVSRNAELPNISLIYIQGVTGGICETSGECSLGQTIPL